MGRRSNRRREDDEDDGLERTWIQSRQVAKRQKTEDNSSQTPQRPSDSSEKIKQKTEDNSSQTPQQPSDSSEKIERMRLKKQRQKEKRSAKKAEASAATAIIHQSNRESQKALHNKKEKEKEKKKKMNQSSKQQQFSTLAMGVKYQDLVIGKGHVVQHRKKVRVSYTLRAKSHTSGKILDSSANFPFRAGKGEVIKGWDIGLKDMRGGGIRRLIVPPGAGYKNKDVGAGKGADLYFQIELLHVA